MAVLHMAKCGKCIESLLGRELPEWQIPVYVHEACLEKTLKDCTENRSHVQATCAPLPHTSVCSQLLYSVVETTWKVICASTGGPESPWHFLWQHMNLSGCAEPGHWIQKLHWHLKNFSFFPENMLTNIGLNYLPAVASHPTPQHTPVSPGFSAYYWEWQEAPQSWERRLKAERGVDGRKSWGQPAVDVLRGQPPVANWAAAQKPQPSVRAPERSTRFLGLLLLGCVCSHCSVVSDSS